VDALKDGLARNMVIRADAIDGQDGEVWLQLCGNPYGPCKCFASSPCGKRILVGGSSGLELGAELLCERSGDKAAEHISHDEPADPAIGFLEGDHASEAEGEEDVGWEGRCGKAGGCSGKFEGGFVRV